MTPGIVALLVGLGGGWFVGLPFALTTIYRTSTLSSFVLVWGITFGVCACVAAGIAVDMWCISRKRRADRKEIERLERLV